MPTIKVLKDHIFTSAEDSDFIAQIKMRMLTNLNTRYQDIIVRNILKIATYLDPRFRHLDFDPIDTKAEDLLLEKTLQLAKASNCQPKYSTPVASNAATTQSEPDAFSSFFADIIRKPPSVIQDLSNKDHEDNYLISCIKTEITKYKRELIDSKLSLLQWWKDRVNLYPYLITTIKHVLCIPATSVASERAFSTAGYVVNKYRSRLTPNNVNTLLFLNKNRQFLPDPHSN